MINIAICGASGKMGHFIADVIASREDCKTVCGIDKFGEKYSDFEIVREVSQMPEKPDVIIDFSNPASLDSLIEYCTMNSVALVIGTTGYSKEEIEKINKAAQQIPVFFTFNMSLGINLLTDLAKRAASILGEQFDIEIVEQHHNQKIDAPSGTAIMLANAINEELDNKYTYVYDRHSVRAKRTKTEIGMHAVRGGTIVGTHEIIFAGRDEVITLKHEAHSKQVFAVGSVNAACFLAGKPAGMYTMADVISDAGAVGLGVPTLEYVSGIGTRLSLCLYDQILHVFRIAVIIPKFRFELERGCIVARIFQRKRAGEYTVCILNVLCKSNFSGAVIILDLDIVTITIFIRLSDCCI